ncbi:hypothetical protein, partial [Escherichia coli]
MRALLTPEIAPRTAASAGAHAHTVGIGAHTHSVA